MRLREIQKEYNLNPTNTVDRGRDFENLIKKFFKNDPKYVNTIKDIWLWNEFPYRSEISTRDTGIDLVAYTYDKKYWAVQCKFFNENTFVDKSTIDSFLSTSSRSFRDQLNNEVRFSLRIIVSTSNNWTKEAERVLHNQDIPIIRIGIDELEESPVDFKKIKEGKSDFFAPKKQLKEHQKNALSKTLEYFKEKDRGKLIMACGTGKTLTSLKIAEEYTNNNGFILFLVPSISLLGQTLNEWSSNSEEYISPICICSDPKVSKKIKSDVDSFSIIDLALPASTDINNLKNQYDSIKEKQGLKVVFSTYQSIDVVSKFQKEINKEFDLIICDEAHRTTGAKLTSEDESYFTKVHDNDFIKSKKRLYMTATPRLYSDSAKEKAKENEIILCSMDDEKLYGEEIYRIGFAEAVEKGLLTDYKVLILTLSEKNVPTIIQELIAKEDLEINLDDVSKLIGCINTISKQIVGDNDLIKLTDPNPMKKIVAFCSSIENSKKITDVFNKITNEYINSLDKNKKEKMISVESMHIDGTMSAPKRNELLNWLKSSNEKCHILTNAKCLSEGIDVPSLDAVMFLSAKNSQIDVVQSVGRVMRKSEGKNYGYIIIPIVIPSNISPELALSDNEKYKVIWTVLNALRAHDDRFNAIVNKIELNRSKPEQILIGTYIDSEVKIINNIAQKLPFSELQEVIFAKLVKKVGDRRYWEDWAREVAEIVNKYISEIENLVKTGIGKENFEKFLDGLRKNINPSITEQESIEMLAQHIITKPIFEALFENYSFANHNPISISMQNILNLLENKIIDKDNESLEKFYESVRRRVSGVDNSEGKQKIIVELYDKFFKIAFPKMVEKLGIVYTPIEVVDFIINSVNDVLKQEFNRTLSDDNIHILDPFTGTGTFITRLLQSNLINKENIEKKYKKEIHANEIVLLAYYIASINIENTYHDLVNKNTYETFEGICLTDTFQLGETEKAEHLFSEFFKENSERAINQKKKPITIIIGNPPYSVGQKSENDNARNQKYEKLEKKIADTYVKESKAQNNKSLYDSYIKAFRWSSDRLEEREGIICFVTNGAWLDSNSTDGFRKYIEKEFYKIYVFNLRGNQRTSGELSRKEGGKIFGEGSRTPIAITLLVKKQKSKESKAEIFYYDIGDYLNREEKLKRIKELSSFKNFKNIDLQKIIPNEYGDWISKRSDKFKDFYLISDTDNKEDCFFTINSNGITTSRDSWVYNFSKEKLINNVTNMIKFYNSELERIKSYLLSKRIASFKNVNIDELVTNDSKKISWSDDLKECIKRNLNLSLDNKNIFISIYRPFNKQYIYFNKNLNKRVYQQPKFFPNQNFENKVICVRGTGISKDFSTIISNIVPCTDLLGHTMVFPLYYTDDNKEIKEGISDFILQRAKEKYRNEVTKEDIFYYVYGLLHSKEYVETFKDDLNKSLPRIPLLDEENFWAFSKAGRALSDLHLNYENIEIYKDVIIEGEEFNNFTVDKIRFISKDNKDTIVYNSHIKIKNIPIRAYDYTLGGRSAIEWIMDRYQVKVNKDSGLENNPNDWCKELGNDRYILDLLLKIINLSLKTLDIVENLPQIDFYQVS